MKDKGCKTIFLSTSQEMLHVIFVLKLKITHSTCPFLQFLFIQQRCVESLLSVRCLVGTGANSPVGNLTEKIH